MTVEVSKQVGYALAGQSYGLAITKSEGYALSAYPYEDIAKQSGLVLLNDTEVQIGKQVVYGLLAVVSPPPGRHGTSQGHIF